MPSHPLQGNRRAIAGVAVLTMLVFAIVPVAAQDEVSLSDDELAWLQSHGPIRYAPDPAYPPFESVDDQGITTGINVDLLNRMSRNLGFDYKIVVYANWSAVLEAKQADEVDLLGSLAATPERAEYMDFIGPYMQVGEVFYMRTDNPTESVNDLGDQTVGYIPSYAGGQWLVENYPDLNLVPVDDTRDGLHKVSTGEIDAFFENIPVAADIIRNDALTNIRIMGEPLKFSEANWGVTKDDPILYSIITKGMASIPPGEQTKVFEYWSGYDLGVQQSATGISPLVRNILIGLGVATVAAGGWGISLRRTVHRRTSDLEQSRQEVLDLNVGLEERVAERTKALQRANQALESFSSTVSHDLKTPLTSIATYNQALAAKYSDQLGDDGRMALERTGHAVLRMGELIDDVLQLAKTAESEIQREPVDASAMAEDILQSLQDAEPDRHVQTSIQGGITLDADPTLLHTILANLLENAWKYTRDAEDATITFGAVHANGRLSCFVQDNGIGFQADEATSIFQPFTRAKGAEGFEGTGLGLATVHRAVERHGGSIHAEATPEGGATFRFDLGSRTSAHMER